MNRETLIAMMQELLQRVLDDHATRGHDLRATPDLPLVGDDSLLSSMALVSFIADVETALARRFGAELVLVNEKALSRRNSPFLTLETLADYILEIAFGDSQPLAPVDLTIATAHREAGPHPLGAD